MHHSYNREEQDTSTPIELSEPPTSEPSLFSLRIIILLSIMLVLGIGTVSAGVYVAFQFVTESGDPVALATPEHDATDDQTDIPADTITEEVDGTSDQPPADTKPTIKPAPSTSVPETTYTPPSPAQPVAPPTPPPAPPSTQESPAPAPPPPVIAENDSPTTAPLPLDIPTVSSCGSLALTSHEMFSADVDDEKRAKVSCFIDALAVCEQKILRLLPTEQDPSESYFLIQGLRGNGCEVRAVSSEDDYSKACIYPQEDLKITADEAHKQDRHVHVLLFLMLSLQFESYGSLVTDEDVALICTS